MVILMRHGSNPISDVRSLQALRMVATYLVRAFDDPGDDEARAQMLLAASYSEVVSATRAFTCRRHVVSGVRTRPGLSRTRLWRDASARAARDVGDPERPRGLPLHRLGAAKPPSRGRGRA